MAQLDAESHQANPNGAPKVERGGPGILTSSQPNQGGSGFHSGCHSHRFGFRFMGLIRRQYPVGRMRVLGAVIVDPVSDPCAGF